MKGWYYDKWYPSVKEYLPDNIEIESVVPSVWNGKHVQVVFKENGKRYCREIPEKYLDQSPIQGERE